MDEKRDVQGRNSSAAVHFKEASCDYLITLSQNYVLDE